MSQLTTRSARGEDRTSEVRRPRYRRTPLLILALWGFGYACYRAYYAAGGTFGIIGHPVSATQYRTVNAIGSVVILFAAIVPAVAVRAFPRAVPVLGWIVAVGCSMHAFVDGALRVLSVTGVHPTQLPASVWQSFDRRAADLQDLLLNEPWFLVEGLLWGALGLAFVRVSGRRPWLISAAVACVLLTVVGVLSGLDVIGSFHLG